MPILKQTKYLSIWWLTSAVLLQDTNLILRACSSGILIEIVTNMNILRVRVHYPYPYTDIGVS